MKKLIITAALILCISTVYGQSKDTSKTIYRTFTDKNGTVTCEKCQIPNIADTNAFKASCDTCKYFSLSQNYAFRSDTTRVLAYVCTDWNKAKFKWLHLYSVANFGQYFNLNNLKMYSEYLMPDRKTKSIYKVIYSISK